MPDSARNITAKHHQGPKRSEWKDAAHESRFATLQLHAGDLLSQNQSTLVGAKISSTPIRELHLPACHTAL